ncbi:MBL fold metallo-hydrolase [Nonomuraea roseoviolacea]|uniref:Glyoxylase-like metal-dependent hydrolase (Beta-lactamase superfamily II) n=1 Tax=Nonomuraea roseoviolacea subsp. carminata TaxID=160689 RepID=A0ABT1KGL5_9ACTN|nr:MBL fold metallo-hydrolase [Nonomuraea roseoviolacea]MCP2352114.1 glyoxylase-like metal-dependent hydrolase (beta-lactamase superfamily II) [Nonomuraea roseoviolacea subsp. carminata]
MRVSFAHSVGFLLKKTVSSIGESMRLISRGRHHARFAFGDLQVISLRDGYIDMPPTRLRDEEGRTLDELPPAVPLAGGNLRLSVNAFFVTDGTRSVLVDTGASDNWHDPTMGLIYDALDEAGIDRALVTDVAITHDHEDHVSGLIMPDGSEAFTGLERVWIGAGDASVFTGRLEPLRDRVVPVSEKIAINDWVTAIPTPGHTPGHTVYEVRSAAGRLLVWGDTVHVPTLQFEQPNVSWEFDGDQPQARAARAALLERLTQPHHFVAGAHLDSPGIARVTASGDGYALEYLAPPIG